ncbi:universal stress protein [Rhodobacteraceae bacterium D3-12]|nr:universal stress protein [Rhodobacteraceae bacterium D3-12]
MKMIMVATDFSERSDRALRRATLLARQFEAKLHLVHVVDDDQPKRVVDTEHDQASKLLRQLAETIRNVDGVSCDIRVMLASPFAGIVRAAKELGPDLLVMGPHRRQVLSDVFIGTTVERTIRSVACPVLMVNATPAGRYKCVLQTTDLSEGPATRFGASPRSGSPSMQKTLFFTCLMLLRFA